jgi:hypothetical protein
MNMQFIKTHFTKAIAMIALMSASSLAATAQAPAAPTGVSATPTAVCPSNTTCYLKAVSTGNTIAWYTVSTGGTAVGTSNSNAYFTVDVATTGGNFFCEAVSPTGLVSATRTAVSVGINTEPQIVSLPAPITAPSATGQCGLAVSYSPATVTGIPTPTVTYSDQSGANFNVGTTTILVTAANSCASISRSFDVTVTDNQAPVAIAPQTVAVTLAGGQTGATGVNLGTPTVSDNCGVATITNNAPATFPVGTTTVTWTVTDNNGNSATATQLVTVTGSVSPNQPPVIQSVVENDADNIIGQHTNTSLTTVWTDDAAGANTIDIDWKDSSAHTIISGITARTYTATHTYDKSGLFAPVVKITDAAGLSSTKYVFKYIVVYEVGNYSTNASGCFTAPANAYPANTSLSTCQRSVEFSNNIKPNKCGTGWSGDFDLEMEGAHYEFECEDISWSYLAVSACYQAEFRGTGHEWDDDDHWGCHNNKTGYRGHDYGIYVVQTDKSRNPINHNKIRVKIWDLVTGDIIFDTQMGADDNAAPTTALTCGSINVCVPSNCVARHMSPTGSNDPAINGTTAPEDAMINATAFPNPFTSALNIHVNSVENAPVEYTIMDMLGNSVQAATTVNSNEDVLVNLNVAPGNYLVKIKCGTYSQVLKVMKAAN